MTGGGANDDCDQRLRTGRLASARSAIPSFIVMDVMQAAAACEAAGSDIIHMEVGQPGTPAPAAARDAVRRALDSDPLGYTLALGTAELRERISRYYRDQHGLDISPGRVIVTTGSSSAFVLAFLALFDAGARVALPSPGYPCYRHVLSALGCEPVMIETGHWNRWMPEAVEIDRAAAAGRLSGLLIASPSNPTGTMLSADRMRGLIDACRRHGMRFISDEIYHGLTYDRPAGTALSVSGDAVVINSFSKYYSMTGWRIGWMVVPQVLVRTFERLAQNLYISPPAIAQTAALGAFDGIEELEANKRIYAENRALLLGELPKLGFEKIAPADGAFYIYCDVSAVCGSSVEYARRMLNEAGVAVTPGIDFDPAHGHRFIRMSYAGTTSAISEALRRLRDWRGTAAPD